MTGGGSSNCRDLVFLGLICLVVSFASQSTVSGRFLAVLVKFEVHRSLKGRCHESPLQTEAQTRLCKQVQPAASSLERPYRTPLSWSHLHGR